MGWLDTLNTGANLHQAGQLSSLASTQGSMLNFQISQAISEEMKKAKIVETRMIVVKLKGILEDAISYIPTHPSYAAIIISMCKEIEESIGVDESNFQEISDMEMARKMKRVSRQAKSELGKAWNDEIALESDNIANALSTGNNLAINHSMIPDEGELLQEVYSIIQRVQTFNAPPFNVDYHGNSGRQHNFSICELGDSFDISIGAKGMMGLKWSVKLNSPDGSKEEITVLKQKGREFSGDFTLPNERAYHVDLTMGALVTTLKSTMITNADGILNKPV